MINTDQMLNQRLQDLDPGYVTRNDPIFHASLTMTRNLLRLVAVACDAEGLTDHQTMQIVDRVIIGSMASPAYIVLMGERDDLLQQLIKRASTEPFRGVYLNNDR